MRKQNGAVCMGKRSVEIILIFVFKNVVIVDCIDMSQSRCHMTTKKTRVSSEARDYFNCFLKRNLVCYGFSYLLLIPVV
jgi:hypothetical protein